MDTSLTASLLVSAHRISPGQCSPHLSWSVLTASLLVSAHRISPGQCSPHFAWSVLTASRLVSAHRISPGQCSPHLSWSVLTASLLVSDGWKNAALPPPGRAPVHLLARGGKLPGRRGGVARVVDAGVPEVPVEALAAGLAGDEPALEEAWRGGGTRAKPAHLQL